MALSDEELRAQVRAVINRIEPLPFSQGPNYYTVDVDGWGISAPTRPEVAKLVWGWFNDERPLMAWMWDDLCAALQKGNENG